MIDFSFWLRKTFPDSVRTTKRVYRKRKHRTILLEQLEDRVTPSVVAAKSVLAASPPHSPVPDQGQGSFGGLFTPSNIQIAYGVNQLIEAGENGKGETIALIDPYDDIYMYSSTSLNFDKSDLHLFDEAMGLPDPPSFIKYGEINNSDQFTSNTLNPGFPAPNPGPPGEESLDVEWAHAIAPEANIILVEAQSFATINAAADWAASLPSSPAGGGGANVVSMSFGTPGGYYGETAGDSVFAPLSYPGVTFLASAGDEGSINPNTQLPGTGGILQNNGAWGESGYPSDSINVVSVGGTSLYVVGAGADPYTYSYETAWNDGFEDATGGGISNFESQPYYQSIAAAPYNTAQRTTPDVSFLADPDTGVVICTGGVFSGVGGTSLSSPCWAGLVAISDQIRASEGESSLSGPTQTLPILYNLYDSVAYDTDFHDITLGGNGTPGNGDYDAEVGYDLTSGIGTPIANNLMPDLANLQQMIYASPTGINNYVLAENAGVLDLTDNGILVDYQPASLTTSIDIGGLDGGGTVANPADNSLTIDYSGGEFSGTIDFNGGLGSGEHLLTVEGGTFPSATYTFTGAGSGSITLGGQTISYTNATLVADKTSHKVETINLASGAQASLQDDNDFAYIPGFSEITSLNGGFVTTMFVDPVTSLTVNTFGGSSVVQLNLMDSAFDPIQETFNGETGDVYEFVAQDAVLPTTDLAINTATLDLKGLNPTINALTGNGLVTSSVSGASGVITLTVGSGGGSGTYSGSMVFSIGYFSLRKAGGGTEVLTGVSSFSGLTTVIGGVLQDGVANALPGGTFMTVTVPGTFDLNGFNQQVADLNGTGTVTDSGAAATYTVTETAGDLFLGVLTGSLALVDSGSGTLTLDSEETYTGQTTVSGGTLVDGIVNALPIGTTLTVTAPGTFDMNGFAQEVASVEGNGTVTDSGAPAAFTVDNSTADIFFGTLTGNLSLVMTGGGLLVLDNANSYSGSTTINSGTIADGIFNALPIGTNLIDDGTFDLVVCNQQVASVTGTGTVTTDSGAAATFTVSNVGPDTFAGLLTGGLSLTVNGGGTLTLLSANTYTGATEVGPGTLVDGIANALPIGTALTVAAGGTFDMNGFNQQVASVTGPGTVTDSGASATFTVDDSTADSFAGNLTGSLALTQIGAGTLTLSSANTYTGATTVTAGTLADGINNALPAGTALSVAGTFDLAGFNQQVAGVTGSGTVTDSDAAATFTVNNSAADTFAGTLTGSLALAKINSGTLQLDNTANTYTGPTSVSAGTLDVVGSIASSSGVTISGTGTLDGDGTTGPVTATAGTLAPGQSAGVLTTGSLNLQSGSAFNVLIGGNTLGEYSQDYVNSGSVTLSTSGSGVALNFAASSAYVPNYGDNYTIIDNLGGNPIVGTFVAGTGVDYVAPGTPLPQGAVLSTDFLGSGDTATITYTAGPNHDSVAIIITPTITIDILNPSEPVATQGPVTYSVLYLDSDPTATVTSNLTTADVTLNSTGTASGTVSSVVEINPGSYTVTLSNLSGDGTLSISIGANTATDNEFGIAVPTGPSTSFIVNNTAPTVAISSPSSEYTAHGSVSYTVTYFDTYLSSTNLTPGGITLNNPTGNASGVVAVSAGTVMDSGMEETYTVTISNTTGNGTLGITVDAGTAVDLAGNGSLASGASTTFVVDNTPPTVTIGAPSLEYTAHASVSYTVTYFDTYLSSANLTTGGISLSNPTGNASGVVAVSAGTITDSGMEETYTVTISDITGNGTLGISVAADTAIDLAGNESLASGPSATFVVDNIPPSVTIGGPSSNYTANGPVTYTVNYYDAYFDSANLTPSEITLNNPTGNASGVVAVSAGTVTDSGLGMSYTVTISGTKGNGSLNISIAADTAVDLAGNEAPAAGPSTSFIVDNTLPTVTIGTPSVPITATGAVKYTVSYFDTYLSSANLTPGDITLNNPTGNASGVVAVSAGTFTDSGMEETYTVTISNTTGNGTLGISVAPNTAVDLAGNEAPAAGPSQTFVVDNTLPTVTVSAPSHNITAGGPITYGVSYYSAYLSSSSLTTGGITLINPTGNASGDVAVSAGTFTDSGMEETYTVTISNTSGNGTLGISVAAGTAVDLAGNESLASSPSAAFIVDNTPPSVTVGAPSVPITATGAVAYTVNYFDTNFGTSSLIASNITLNTTNTASGVVSVSAGTVTDSGLGMSYTVTIGGISGNGTLGITVAPNTAVDLAGNEATGAGPSQTFVVDNLPPVVSISGPSLNYTSSGPISYTVSFVSANFGSSDLTTGDITLNKTGNVNGTVSVSGSGETYKVTVSNITGNGELGISVAADAAVDQAGNEAPAAGPSSTFIVDSILPTVTISAPSVPIPPAGVVPSVPITASGPVTYTVTYEDAYFGTSNLNAADITLNSTGGATGVVSVSAGTVTDSGLGMSYTVTVSNIAGNGTLGISVAANTAIDLAGNESPATGPSQTFVVDNTPPTVTIGKPSYNYASSGPISFEVAYADDYFGYSNLTAADITLDATGGPTGDVSVTGAGTSYTVTISNITGNGTLGISVAADTSIDQAGDEAPASGPSATFVVDNTPPTVTISAPSIPITASGPVTYTVKYYDPYFGSSYLTAGDVILNNYGMPASGTVSVTPVNATTYTVTISHITGNGTLGFSIDAGTAVDLAGNLAPASAPSATFTVDTTPPAIMLYNPSTSFTGSGPVTYEVSYLSANFQSSMLSTSNVNLIATGTAKGTLSFDDSTGDTRIVTISKISGIGTLGISIDSGSAIDLAGNLAPASGPSATFTVYNTPPTVTISAPSVKSTISGPVSYTITYKDPYLNTSSISLSPASIQLITSNPGQSANITVTGFGNTRTVTLSQITGGKGVMGIIIDPGTASDQAGNTAPQATSTKFTVTGAPKIKITSGPATTVAPGGSLSYTFRIANTGTQAAVGVTFEQVPPAAAIVSLANNPGWTAGSNGEYFFTIGTLAAGTSVTVTFNVTVPTTAKLNSTLVDAMYVLDSIGLESSTSLKSTITKTGRRS